MSEHRGRCGRVWSVCSSAWQGDALSTTPRLHERVAPWATPPGLASPPSAALCCTVVRYPACTTGALEAADTNSCRRGRQLPTCQSAPPLPPRDRSVRRSAEWRRLKRDMGWWAGERPGALVAFVREAHELLAGAGGSWPGATARGWADAPWRRSAVAYLEVRA